MWAWCCQLQPVVGAALFYQCDKQIGQCQRFGTQSRHRVLARHAVLRRQHAVQATLQGGHAQNRRGATQVTGDTRRRLVIWRKRKRRSVPEPACQRLPEAVGMARVDPYKRRGTRAAIEELVTAPYCKISVVCLHLQRHGPGAVRQVPDHQRPRLMGSGGYCRQVKHGTAAVVHMREQEYGNFVGDGRFQLCRVHQLQVVATLAAQGLRDVQVGREIASFTEHPPALRCVLCGAVQRGAEHLVQVDRGGVRGDYRSGTGTD